MEFDLKKLVRNIWVLPRIVVAFVSEFCTALQMELLTAKTFLNRARVSEDSPKKRVKPLGNDCERQEGASGGDPA